MREIVVEAVLPILAVMALGYALGRKGFFTEAETQGLSKLVLNIALPAALFISIQKASRAELLADGTLMLVSLIGIVGLFLLSYLLCRKIFHRSMQEAAVCALVSGSPTIGFLGLAVLEPVYGSGATTDLVVGCTSIATKAVAVPVGMALLATGLQKSGMRPEHTDNDEVRALLGALRQPVCWAPLLSMALVLLDLRVPTWIDPCFDLVDKTSSGAAVLAAGVELANVKFMLSREVVWNTAYRLLLSPAAVLALGIGLGLAPGGDSLPMLVSAVALPSSISGVIIGTHYGVYAQEGASTMAASTACFAGTALLWAWLAPVVCRLVS